MKYYSVLFDESGICITHYSKDTLADEISIKFVEPVYLPSKTLSKDFKRYIKQNKFVDILVEVDGKKQTYIIKNPVLYIRYEYIRDEIVGIKTKKISSIVIKNLYRSRR